MSAGRTEMILKSGRSSTSLFSRCPLTAKGVWTIGVGVGQMATETWSDRLYSAPSAFCECTCLCHIRQIPLTRELNQNPLAPLRSESEGRRRKLPSSPAASNILISASIDTFAAAMSHKKRPHLQNGSNRTHMRGSINYFWCTIIS
jgi:hypothetical protein